MLFMFNHEIFIDYKNSVSLKSSLLNEQIFIQVFLFIAWLIWQAAQLSIDTIIL